MSCETESFQETAPPDMHARGRRRNGADPFFFTRLNRVSQEPETRPNDVQRILQHGILRHRHFDRCLIVQKFGMDAPAVSACRRHCLEAIVSHHGIQRNRDAVRLDHHLVKIRSVPAQRSTASQTASFVKSTMRQNRHALCRIQRIPGRLQEFLRFACAVRQKGRSCQSAAPWAWRTTVGGVSKGGSTPANRSIRAGRKRDASNSSITEHPLN
jgi:hypothetical protein